MKRENIQKVSRVLVASTLATASVALVSPPLHTVQAAGFKDLTPSSSHYVSVKELVARNIISGYPDGTFRPNQSVTRAQAAKMIALSLNLNLKNRANPKFKDMPSTHPYYKYIAALAEEGVISGFSDNTFRPNEAVTRGQIAKILVRGFKFEEATTVGTTFRDVNANTSNALAIQTLFNLKITNGTSPVEFSPYKHVTRGQLASFILSSENVKAQKPVSYKITGISGSTIYINSIPYTISDELQGFINEDNARVLKGAVIEGRIVAQTLLSISQLTLNASGTKNNFLTFAGNYETFSGNIMVKGNYIRFEDFDLTGTMTITETVRKTLDQYMTRLPNSLQASAFQSFGFINWTTTPAYMPTVDKTIEFVGTTVKSLIIAHDKTKVIADNELDFVTVLADVREVELLSDIARLDINTDVPLTVYGKGDIKRTNFNSVTDLNLYTDGYISVLAIDNTFGWVDLGPDTLVKKVILPVGVTPNDVFSDYLVDYTNITNIEDTTGKPVDKNPIENQQPVDKIPPVVTNVAITSLDGGQAKVDFTVNEAGNYYYMFKEKGEDAPTLKELVKGPPIVTNRTGRAYVGSNSFTASGLKEKTDYVLYLVAVDGKNNVSTPITAKEFYMKDSVPPTISGFLATPLYGGQRMGLSFRANEPGDYYYYYREGPGPKDVAITANYIMTNAKGTGKVTTNNQLIETTITGLLDLTNYEVYVVLKDESGNLSVVQYDMKRTLALDSTSPYIPLERQTLERTGVNQFTVYFSEALDYDAANNVNNYILSGTGIVNMTGQTTIKPTSVTYRAGDTKAVLTVPTTTGLVNNDTIRVTIQPTLLDLAANPFENSNIRPNPRNYAVYRHGDTVKPILTIDKFEANTDYTHGLLDLETSEAGTYYYVILPSINRIEDLSMRDIMDRKLQAYLPTGINNQVTLQTVAPKYYGEFAPIELGKSTLDIPIPNDLSPFYQWNMYIFMTDRSGNLTNAISTVEMVKDRTAPVITTSSVEVQPGDRTAKLVFGSDEAGGARYILKEKYRTENGQKVLNDPATLAQVKNSSTTLQMVQGPNSPLFNVPSAHTDYVLYYAMYDTAGNYTELKTTEFYSDGTIPVVDDIIIRDVNNRNEFEITFSEGIMRDANEISQVSSSNWATLMNMTGANISDYDFVSYTPGTFTTSPSRLVIRDKDGLNVDTTFTVNMNATAYDSIKVNNQFNLNDFGKYLYRKLDAAFIDISFVPNTNDRYVDATFDLITESGQEFELGEVLKYYYLSATTLTPETTIQNYTSQQVINTVLTGTDSSLATGTGTISTNVARAVVELSHPTKFVTGDWVVIVLEDKYGNLNKVYQRVGYIYTPTP